MNIVAQAVAPITPNITLTLTGEEAKKLRRVCYYNKTVAKKFAENEIGGQRKADDLLSFMSSLGNGLKLKGVERF